MGYFDLKRRGRDILRKNGHLSSRPVVSVRQTHDRRHDSGPSPGDNGKRTKPRTTCHSRLRQSALRLCCNFGSSRLVLGPHVKANTVAIRLLEWKLRYGGDTTYKQEEM